MVLKNEENGVDSSKILLLMLPFWTPLNPPLGITCLKVHLSKHGYNVKTADANIDYDLSECLYDYNEVLAKYIPNEKHGNFNNTSHKVLKTHSMAYLNKKSEDRYLTLVDLIIKQHFFCELSIEEILELDEVLETYFDRLSQYITRSIEEHHPTIIGISVYTGTLPSTMFAFQLIKEKFPHIHTIMGGGIFADELAPSSPDFKKFLGYAKDIDAILIGEGENLFLKYLKGDLMSDSNIFTLDDIGSELYELSEAQVPDFTDFDLPSYTELSTYVSRSCPYQCSFCSETVQWGKYRLKDIQQVVGELRELYRKYNYQLYLLSDSLLNPFIDRLSDELIRQDLSIYWDGYLRADKEVCHPENTFKWRKAGFYRARLGVESGSQHVLDLMNKRITPDQIKAAVSSLAKAGIKTTTYWVIGHPEETEEDFKQTLDLITELKDDIYEAECNPFQYFVKAQIDSDHWERDYKVSSLYPDELADMLYFQTWIIDAKPVREEIYARVIRFTNHCRSLGIPNPYSLRELYEADKRWKSLHDNAVPFITQFKNTKEFIDENRYIRNYQSDIL